MDKDLIKVEHLENMKFSTETDGYEIIIDAHSDFGGNNAGPRPKPLLLTALGGCTSMDVVHMLRKMRVEYDKFSVFVKGELSNEIPKIYKKIHVTYDIWGDNIPVDKIKSAVEMSEQKYCGVSYMLRFVAEISSEIIINGKSI